MTPVFHPSVVVGIATVVAILATTAAYLVKGSVPDVFLFIDTTLIGGFLGTTPSGTTVAAPIP